MRPKRQIHTSATIDHHVIESLGFNIPAGGFKNVPIGPKLVPLSADGATYTTNATTSIPVGMPGLMLAVYNNSGSVGSVTVSKTQVASLAAGITDANANVGVACIPNAWTYIAMGEATWIIASASTLLVYQIDDDSYLSPQP